MLRRARCNIVTASRLSVRPSVCLSLCLSVCLPVTLKCRNQFFDHRLEFFENNFTVSYPGCSLFADPNIMAPLQKEHSQNLAGIGEGMGKWLLAYKSFNISETGKIGPRLPLRTNRKSHTRFRSVPKSTTLSDLEGSLCTFSKHMQENTLHGFLATTRFLLARDSI